MTNLCDVFAFWRSRSREVPFAVLFKKFQNILERNNRILELMADMGDKLGGEYVFDRRYIETAAEQLGDQVFKLISDLSVLSQTRNADLFLAFEHIQHLIQEELDGRPHVLDSDFIVDLGNVGLDQTELVGGKLAHLGEIRSRLELETPDGFIITTRAFFDFMNQHGLLELARKGRAAWDGKDDRELGNLAGTIQHSIMTAPLPRGLASRILSETDILLRDQPPGTTLAVRSSAWNEDGESTFAGQYASELGIGRDGIVDAYRTVLASAYSLQAWKYRIMRGYREHEIAMAVGCQALISGTVSGVLHTYAPHLGTDVMVISAVRGQCRNVVDGTSRTLDLLVDRTPPYDFHPLDAAPLSCDDADMLSADKVGYLAETAMTLERYYKRPQDIEWTFDLNGRLVILQARPLQFRPPREDEDALVAEAVRGADIIFSRRGQTAQRGVATGPVHVVRTDRDLDTFPDGAILVARHTSPRYSRVMRKARGIITDIGSPTGHMSTIAREFRVPCLVGTETATSLLHNGDEITLDASSGTVYRGRITALDQFEITADDAFEDSYEYRLLKRLLGHISPLNLVDPHKDNFTPRGCRTFHDITRYIHETAIRELINLSEKQGRRYQSTPRRLITEVPLGLMIIDAGGATSTPPGAREVQTKDITCSVLTDFLGGIRDSRMWCTEPVSVNLGSFMSSFTRTFSTSMAAPDQIGRNLVVALGNYMNVNMRLGYHFNIINAYVGKVVNDNYILFRFMGGVTEYIRRSRRARFVSEVLEYFDFRVEIHGDLVVGRVKKMDRIRMTRRLRMLGALVGYARQLDARLHSENDVNQHVHTFITAMNDFIGGDYDGGTCS